MFINPATECNNQQNLKPLLSPIQFHFPVVMMVIKTVTVSKQKVAITKQDGGQCLIDMSI
jgi:hypothetical protein